MSVGEDRISELSDALLLHILSFLPTKSVVSTCILSKRWRYLYTSIPILDFREWRSPFSSPVSTSSKEDCLLNTKKFMNFLDRLLLSPLHYHQHDVIIQKFCLSCDNFFDKSRVIDWISTLLIRRKVEELSLSIYIKDFMFPPCFFTCETLTMLELEMQVILNLPKSISFPRLKILRLKYIMFVDDKLTERFFSNCPVLEELILTQCSWMGLENFCISAPALKRLIINGSLFAFPGLYEVCVIKIYAPNLLSLECIDAVPKDYVLLHSFSSLVDANIDCGSRGTSEERRFSVSKLIAGLSNVKLLKMSGNTFEALYFAGDLLTYLPKFYNLIRLEVSSQFSCETGRPLLDFLHISPNLESLVFTQGLNGNLSNGDPVWAENLVPECLLLHLKAVEFREFHGKLRELNVIKFFLKNSRILERMTILSSSTLSTIDKNKVVEKLVKFPRGSTSCEVNFS
ncbi:F-box domain [Macleaya cordata]|uniref:F-box domain n=1 Tax=Macleaya cordata TaxID=56857 RepID=A0A200PNZ6_MACCD|nr:F-box domain [Macleaya cordata]